MPFLLLGTSIKSIDLTVSLTEMINVDNLEVNECSDATVFAA